MSKRHQLPRRSPLRAIAYAAKVQGKPNAALLVERYWRARLEAELVEAMALIAMGKDPALQRIRGRQA